MHLAVNRSTSKEAITMSNPPVSLTVAPEGHTDWLADLKGCTHSAQQSATLAVNHELMVYWQIGCDILARQAKQG